MASDSYLPILVLLVAGAAFAIGPLVLAWVWAKKFSPHKSGPSKNAVYECGLESKGDAWIQFKPGYYLYAIIFLVFDVEAVFLLPFAVAFHRLHRRGMLSPCWSSCFCWSKAWSGPGRRTCCLDMTQD